MRARLRRPSAVAAVLGVAIGLSGCVSLFPKSKPAQLYTFGLVEGGSDAAAPAGAVAFGQRTGVMLAAVTFPRAAQGDTLLTMTGAQAAYIEESRWTAPAVVLFREAVERRFDEKAQRSRLVARGDLGRTSLILRLDVREFEADYAVPEGIPTVVVSLRARLTRADGTPLDEKTFEVRRPAAENRVSAIVAGLDSATGEVLDGVVAWTDAAAGAAPAGGSTPTRAASTPSTPSTTGSR